MTSTVATMGATSGSNDNKENTDVAAPAPRCLENIEPKLEPIEVGARMTVSLIMHLLAST